MRLSILLLIFFSFFAGHVAAGESQEIELNDGSVIFGNIVSLEDDIYTIESIGLGSVRVERSKIRAIRPRSMTDTTEKELNALEQKMMSDDEIITMLLALERDPLFKEILEDPEIMEKVLSGNIHGLMSDPKFLKLLENPTIQDIKSKIQE
jgi:hypothetical protein